jgi:hypothetical protein
MRSWIKIPLYLIGFVCLSFFLYRFCHFQTKGFRAGNITKAFSYDPRWDVCVDLTPEEEAEILQSFDKPFYFLSKGGTADVFRSADDKYVIKFFKRSRFFPPFWATFPLTHALMPIKSNKVIARKKEQKELQFTSYKIAIEQLKEQTGMVYLHLNPTSHFQKKITLYDRIGVKHIVDADQTLFAIQKKATAFPVRFKKLLADGNIEEAKEALTQFALILNERAEKGIRDADIGPRFNLGFLGTRLVTFDVDQLRTTKLASTKREHIFQDAKEMFHWLGRKDPSLISFLEAELSRLQPETSATCGG